jgi:ANTH domain
MHISSVAGEHVRNIREYSAYLEEKVLAYRDLHVDYVKATANGKSGRLRRLPVSQGLLRETSILQRQIAGLLKCQVSRMNENQKLKEPTCYLRCIHSSLWTRSIMR